jgi:hypothetical protein
LVEHLLDQFALFAALRFADRCLAIHADAQGLGHQQRPVLEIVEIRIIRGVGLSS